MLTRLSTVLLAVCVPLVISAAEPAAFLNDGEDCAGRRANCIAPRSATVTAIATHSATLPVAQLEADDECALRACCVSPAANSARDITPKCAMGTVTLHELLLRWQAASADQRAWTARDREWLRRRTSVPLSAHALELVTRLTQPVTVSSLQRDFTWQIAAVREATAVLTAIPHDEATRLFCSELHIELDTKTGKPNVIDVVHRAASQVVTVKAEGTSGTGTVITADLLIVDVDGMNLPPSPVSPTTRSMIRIAADTLEISVPR